MPVLVGCCGFPEARARYYREFPLVEVQKTFYQPPRPATAERWRQEAPPGFLFAMKAWQLITHDPSSPTYRRLREPLEGPPEAYGLFRPTAEVRRAWLRTREVARRLGARLLLFQAPARFDPVPEHVARLRAFFRLTEAERDGLLFLWEPRGRWTPALVGALAAELDLLPVTDPLAPGAPPWPPGGPRRGATAAGWRRGVPRLAYFRLHGVGGYRYRYTDADLERLAERCRQAEEAGAEEVLVLFNNTAMLEDARRFRARLGGGPGGA
ncbi:MAG: DUF72 domain-containing protein, partial [Clostridia bacterium]|nr:DUF72 domain-containing protein [Clostridia bacterium]